MYLTADSVIYTTSGWKALHEIPSPSILLVACCNIIGELSWSLTRLIINYNTDTSNRFYRRTLDNGYNNLIANGLYNTELGWEEPNKQQGVRMFDGFNVTTGIINISHNIEPGYSFNNICNVIGLPIGVIVDYISIYPGNVMNATTPDITPDKNYFFRRKCIDYQPLNDQLRDKEAQMIIDSGYIEPQYEPMVGGMPYNPLLD